MEDEEVRLGILDLLDTMQQACKELYEACGEPAEGGESAGPTRLQALELIGDMKDGLQVILVRGSELEKSDSRIKLSPAVLSIQDSLLRIRRFCQNGQLAKAQQKIEFELHPLLQEAFAQFYFWGYQANRKDGVKEYLEHDRACLYKNDYIDEAVESGSFKYEVAFVVFGYNKLEFTKMCVESLLKNIPTDLDYELILVNHGSTDGTREYFESIHPTKQLDIKVNGGGLDAASRIIESEYVMQISNDVILTPGAISNMLACMKSDPRIAWVVPSTPGVSNLQTIPASYQNWEELEAFAAANNQRDPFRWEQRVRLCNPISLYRAETFLSEKGAGPTGYIHSTDVQSFPDDRVSLLLRRSGYKMMLAKDSYCHHFGGVTLKSEIEKKGEQEFYLKGRKEFYKAFSVDPWGPGFCYDPAFLNRLVSDHEGHVDILGINCGIGSSSLRIKEQLKEYCHNTDATLYNVTDEARFLPDLKGIGEEADQIGRIQELDAFLSGRTFHYVVWETPFLEQKNFQMLYGKLLKSILSGGRLLMKKNGQNQRWIEMNQQKLTALGDLWYMQNV